MLTTAEGRIDLTRISALVDQLVWLREQGYEVILVSSGAGACGKTLLIDVAEGTVSEESPNIYHKDKFSRYI